MVVAAGLCQAAVKAARSENRFTRERVLLMVSPFIDVLSPDLRQAAMATFIAGDIVELAVGHIVEAAPSGHGCLGGLLYRFSGEPQGRERLSSKGVVDQLLLWVAKWLAEVGHVMVWCE